MFTNSLSRERERERERAVRGGQTSIYHARKEGKR